MLAPTDALPLPPLTSSPSIPDGITTLEVIVKVLAPLTLTPAPEVLLTVTPLSSSPPASVTPAPPELAICGLEPDAGTIWSEPDARPAD